MKFAVENKFVPEMYDLACKALTQDRRFHLDEYYNENLSHKVICSYINDYLRRDHIIYTARYNNTIVGYTFILIDNNTVENILGVTMPTISGKVAAYPLYCGMLNELQNWGIKKYLGTISSSNLPSLNLHIQLGAQMVEVKDKYILRDYYE